MELENLILSKINQIQKDKYFVSSLICEYKIVKFIEADSRLLVAGAPGRRKWGMMVIGHKVSIMPKISKF